jgi:hypothetical protein
VTRIAPFHGLPISGPSGFSAARPGGHLPGDARPASGFGSKRGLVRSGSGPGSGPATGWVWALAGLGLAAAATWRRAAARRGTVGVDPAALHLHCTSARPPEAGESVSVLIPVRHEPDPAVAAVRAALSQRGVDRLDVVVLDDGCPQETRTALRREFADDPRVRLLAAAPLPRGWSPLAHRSHQLAVAARGRVLIFAEPCAPLGPNAAASATALLRGEHLDLAVLDTGRPAASLTQPARTARPARPHGARSHPGRFAVAVDADAYWRIGGYRAAAGDPDPLALLRTVRRASGRAAVADGRRVIPPAQVLATLPAPDPQAEAEWDSLHSSRGSLTETARRVFAALVGTRP